MRLQNRFDIAYDSSILERQESLIALWNDAFSEEELHGLISEHRAFGCKTESISVDYLILLGVYDRARELFYYLKGGQVDYCEEHNKVSGYSQFGRIYMNKALPSMGRRSFDSLSWAFGRSSGDSGSATDVCC